MSFINAGANGISSKVDIIKDNELDNLYYNIALINRSNVSVLAQYNDVKSETILDDPWNYYLEVERINLPCQSVPIVGNWDNTAYFVTLVDTAGVSHSAPVEYIPNVSNINLYNGNNEIYSYKQIQDMINQAFVNAYALIPSGNIPVGITAPPYILYEGPNIGFSMNFQPAYDPSVVSPTINVWMNDRLYYLFDSWETFYAGENNANHQDFRFIVNNAYGQYSVTTPAPFNSVETVVGPPSTYTTTPTAATVTMLRIPQEYPTLYNLQSLKTIVFKCPALPVRSEFVPGVTSQLNWDNILTDFQPDSGEPSGFRSYLQFSSPSFGYRLIDMLHSQPLRNISVAVYWRDTVGHEYPIYVPPNDSITIKIRFIKRSLFKQNYCLTKC